MREVLKPLGTVERMSVAERFVELVLQTGKKFVPLQSVSEEGVL